MRIFTTLVLVFICSCGAYGQKVASSCSAPDSVKAKFIHDAQRLALRYIYDRNSTFKDSADIADIYTQKVLGALLAVYNADSLPDRDSVYMIHTLGLPEMRSVRIMADHNTNWTSKLKQGIIPTGDAKIDSLLSLYHLSFVSKFELSKGAVITLQSDRNYNMAAISTSFKKIPGVILAETIYPPGDGYDIYYTPHDDYIELIYVKAWVDCQAGCIHRKHWKFYVYPDCSVEFVNNTGPAKRPLYLSCDARFKIKQLNSEKIELWDSSYMLHGYQRWFSMGDGNLVHDSTHFVYQYLYDGDYDICLTVEDTVSKCRSTNCQRVTIKTIPKVMVKSPNGGELIGTNSQYPIKWDASNKVDSVSLYYSLNNGGQWNLITTAPVLNGSYSWHVPATPSQMSKIKIVADTSSTVFDESDSVFTIYDASSINEELQRSGFVCYPNPSGGQLSIKADIPFDKNAHITIHDLTGRVVYSQTPERGVLMHSINLSLNPGVYTLTLTNAGLSGQQLIFIR